MLYVGRWLERRQFAVTMEMLMVVGEMCDLGQ